MRRLMTMATALTLGLGLAAQSAAAADAVTIQLKWVTQAQFAGYFVAKDKGLYEAEGLDVTINPGGPVAAEFDIELDDVHAALAYASRAVANERRWAE